MLDGTIQIIWEMISYSNGLYDDEMLDNDMKFEINQSRNSYIF